MKNLNLTIGIIFFVSALFSYNAFAGCITKALTDSETGVVTFYEVSLSKSKDALLVSILDANKSLIRSFTGHPIQFSSDARRAEWLAQETFYVDSNGSEIPFDGYMKVEKFNDMKSRILYFQYQGAFVDRYSCLGVL